MLHLAGPGGGCLPPSASHFSCRCPFSAMPVGYCTVQSNYKNLSAPILYPLYSLRVFYSNTALSHLYRDVKQRVRRGKQQFCLCWLERVGKACNGDMMQIGVCSGNLHFCSSKLSRREYKADDFCRSFSFTTLFSLPNFLCQSWHQTRGVTTGRYGYCSQQHRRNLPSQLQSHSHLYSVSLANSRRKYENAKLWLFLRSPAVPFFSIFILSGSSKDVQYM